MEDKQLKLSICEETEKRLKNFLTKDHHADRERINFVILKGEFVFASIIYLAKYDTFHIDLDCIDECGGLISVGMIPPFKKKNKGLELFETHFSSDGVKTIEDSEGKAEKFLLERFHNETNQVRANMLIAMNHATNQ